MMRHRLAYCRLRCAYEAINRFAISSRATAPDLRVVLGVLGDVEGDILGKVVTGFDIADLCLRYATGVKEVEIDVSRQFFTLCRGLER